ncbi:MAG: hypothetical protein B6U85_09330 [Desulfurococcales archaeon ex4484_42]|nr:MAG: hypothetical protein B6U85_09330 [Desulfurococcales archaeon ex4484_42]
MSERKIKFKSIAEVVLEILRLHTELGNVIRYWANKSVEVKSAWLEDYFNSVREHLIDYTMELGNLLSEIKYGLDMLLELALLEERHDLVAELEYEIGNIKSLIRQLEAKGRTSLL